MSSIKGTTITAKFQGTVDFSDEWVDLVYSSLEQNVAIVSRDLLLDEEAGSLSAVLGIECPEGLDPESLVEGIARDAMDKAIRHANGDESLDTAAFPVIMASNVEVFA